jgi:hypothetical protein
MSPSLRPDRRAALAVLATTVLALAAGCASTETGAEWIDPQFANLPLRGSRIMVVCSAAELPVRKLCQDVLAAELIARGASPVIGPDSVPDPQRPVAEAYLGAARAAGARSIFSAALSPDATVVRPGPSVGVGLGGYGGGRVGIGGGIGISLPIGGGSVQKALGATGVLTNVATGRTMWTVRASTPASRDTAAQVSELGKAVVGAAQKAGFF